MNVTDVSLCVCLSQQSLFGSKSAGFGTTTTSAPSFGTGTGLFGNKPTLTLGTGTNTSTFGTSASVQSGAGWRVALCLRPCLHLTFIIGERFVCGLVQVLVQTPLQEVCLGTSQPLEDWGLDWEPASEQVREEPRHQKGINNDTGLKAACV